MHSIKYKASAWYTFATLDDMSSHFSVNSFLLWKANSPSIPNNYDAGSSLLSKEPAQGLLLLKRYKEAWLEPQTPLSTLPLETLSSLWTTCMSSSLEATKCMD